MIRIFHSTPGQKLPHQQDSVTGSIPFALGLLAAWLCCSLPDRPGFANEFPRQFERATIIHFEGEITQQQFKFFESKLKLAERRSSDLVIIVIDSPGGLLQQSLSIGHNDRVRPTKSYQWSGHFCTGLRPYRYGREREVG